MPVRLVIAALSICIACAAVPDAQQASFVFERVNVVPMDSERVVRNATVVVTGGSIASISTGAAKLPDGAVHVDGQGRFLMPALAEIHAHIPGDAAEAERVLFLYVANGIGTIRSMLGNPSHFPLRQRVMRGEIAGPAMILSGPSFNGQTAGTPAAASARVEEQKKAGYDFLKIHPGVPRAAFDAMASTADNVGIRFAGHVPADVGLQRALDAKYSTIDHLDGYVEALAGPGAPAAQNFGVNLMSRIDESRIPVLAAQTAKAGVANVPTQILLETWYGPETPEAMRQWPEMRYANPAEVEQWVATKRQNLKAVSEPDRQRFIGVRRRMIKALHDAGARLLLGSDAPQVWNVPGFSIHRELATYVASGLTPYQALATGTRNVAAHFNVPQSSGVRLQPDWSGTVTTGARANLVLLDANPLENISNTTRIAGVMIEGRWIPKAEIDRRLAQMRR